MMKLSQRWIYLLLTAFTLICGLLLFFYVKNIAWLRGSATDFLVVIFLYTGIKTLFIKADSLKLATFVFLLLTFLEWLQYFDLSRWLDTHNMFVRLVLGSTFDPFDIMMYAFGIVTIVLIDTLVVKKR